jgi:hypothetical protein
MSCGGGSWPERLRPSQRPRRPSRPARRLRPSRPRACESGGRPNAEARLPPPSPARRRIPRRLPPAAWPSRPGAAGTCVAPGPALPPRRPPRWTSPGRRRPRSPRRPRLAGTSGTSRGLPCAACAASGRRWRPPPRPANHRLRPRRRPLWRVLAPRMSARRPGADATVRFAGRPRPWMGRRHRLRLEPAGLPPALVRCRGPEEAGPRRRSRSPSRPGTDAPFRGPGSGCAGGAGRFPPPRCRLSGRRFLRRRPTAPLRLSPPRSLLRSRDQILSSHAAHGQPPPRAAGRDD